MGHQVKDSCGECADTQRQEHISELAYCGVSEYALDVVLHQTNRCREECSKPAGPRIGRLIIDAVRRPQRDLSLKRVVIGAIGVRPVVDRSELRIDDDEVCRELAARPKQSSTAARAGCARDTNLCPATTVARLCMTR